MDEEKAYSKPAAAMELGLNAPWQVTWLQDHGYLARNGTQYFTSAELETCRLKIAALPIYFCGASKSRAIVARPMPKGFVGIGSVMAKLHITAEEAASLAGVIQNTHLSINGSWQFDAEQLAKYARAANSRALLK